MDEEREVRDAEVVGSNRWYSLVEDGEGYSVLDAAHDDDSVADFPHTDEGAEQAWDEFRRRTREAERAGRSARIPKWLFGLVIAGAVCQFITGCFLALALSDGYRGSFVNGKWFQRIQALDQVTYRFLLGSIAVLVGWWVYRKLSAELSRRG